MYVGIELHVFICLVVAKDTSIRSVLVEDNRVFLLLKLSYLGVLTANVSDYIKGAKLPHRVHFVSHINIHHITA